MPQRLTKTPLAELVPASKEWGTDVPDWVHHTGNIELLIAYGELFWPEFEEYDGCILREGFAPESYRGFMEQTGGDRSAVEAVLNHVHILDLLSHSRPDPREEQLRYVGRLLREMWTAKLASQFPGRPVVVSFTDEVLEDPLDYQVTVFQDRESACT